MSALAALLRDLAGLLGAASITYGARLVSPAAGFIVGGVLLLAGALAVGRSGAIEPEDNFEGEA